MGFIANVTIEEALQIEAAAPLFCSYQADLDSGLELALEQVLRTGLNHTLVSDLDVQADLLRGYSAVQSIAESLALEPESMHKQSLSHIVHDGLELQLSLVIPKSVFNEDLEDDFWLDPDVDEEDVPDPDSEVWDCWVLTSQDLHPSVYSGFNFNSYAMWDEQVYGASKEGISILDDNTDEDFQTGVLLQNSSMGMAAHKRFRHGYLGYSGGSPAVKLQVDGGEEKILKVVRSKFTAPRDQVGQKWRFAVAEFKTLEFVELYPIILSKGRRNG